MAEYSITVHGLTGRMFKGDNKYPSSRGPAQKILIRKEAAGRYFNVEMRLNCKCGAKCASAREARAHCAGKKENG